MAGFDLEDGEVIQFRERVGLVRDSYAACELIVTDRRVVVTSFDTKPTAAQGLVFFGLIGGLVAGLLGKSRRNQLTHQIRRASFGAVEVTGKRDLRIESTGEGYAKQWFEISTKQPEQLAGRIHRWAAGQAELPQAIVKPPA